MPAIRTIALLALALSHPAAATDGDAAAAAGEFRHPAAEAAVQHGARALHARGPGARFASVEAAAIDALIYARLQALESHDTSRIRGGTIFAIDHGYSYGSIQVANPRTPHRICYRLGPREVARFHVYPSVRDIHANRSNERLSGPDRRSVSVVDPLHRPLYVLHPSLVIRVYRSEASEPVEVADLRRPRDAALLAGN